MEFYERTRGHEPNLKEAILVSDKHRSASCSPLPLGLRKGAKLAQADKAIRHFVEHRGASTSPADSPAGSLGGWREPLSLHSNNSSKASELIAALADTPPYDIFGVDGLLEGREAKHKAEIHTAEDDMEERSKIFRAQAFVLQNQPRYQTIVAAFAALGDRERASASQWLNHFRHVQQFLTSQRARKVLDGGPGDAGSPRGSTKGSWGNEEVPSLVSALIAEDYSVFSPGEALESTDRPETRGIARPRSAKNTAAAVLSQIVEEDDFIDSTSQAGATEQKNASAQRAAVRRSSSVKKAHVSNATRRPSTTVTPLAQVSSASAGGVRRSSLAFARSSSTLQQSLRGSQKYLARVAQDSPQAQPARGGRRVSEAGFGVVGMLEATRGQLMRAKMYLVDAFSYNEALRASLSTSDFPANFPAVLDWIIHFEAVREFVAEADPAWFERTVNMMKVVGFKGWRDDAGHSRSQDSLLDSEFKPADDDDPGTITAPENYFNIFDWGEALADQHRSIAFRYFRKRVLNDLLREVDLMLAV